MGLEVGKPMPYLMDMYISFNKKIGIYQRRKKSFIIHNLYWDCHTIYYGLSNIIMAKIL